MKRTRHVKEEVELRDDPTGRLLTFVVERDGVTNMPLSVVLGPLGTPPGLSIGATDLERIAAVIDRMRQDAGDWRYVCPDHGYHKEWECAKCNVPVIVGCSPAAVEGSPV